MTTVLPSHPTGKACFQDTVAPFLQSPGLPFADVLDAEVVERAFAGRDGLFATDEIFSTPVVLWAFLAQSLRDGKGAACASAVADITTYLHQRGRPVPNGDTGNYCRARAKLDPHALRDLVGHVARRLEDDAPPSWLWHGRVAKLVDGFTFTMPDTPANQRTFPPLSNQAPGVGLPIARACAVLSLGTATIHDLAVGPYEGKATGETALLRTLLDGFASGDVVVTTLTDPVAYPAEDIAGLYGYRWNAELDIRDIKQTLGLDHLRCKSPEMVARELWVTLLAYNLIRKVIATAAAVHDRQPRQIGFTGTCQSILSSWMLAATGAIRDAGALWATMLKQIAANQVANRPGRIEPRVLKRRRHGYPLMTRPRAELRQELRMA